MASITEAAHAALETLIITATADLVAAVDQAVETDETITLDTLAKNAKLTREDLDALLAAEQIPLVLISQIRSGLVPPSTLSIAIVTPPYNTVLPALTGDPLIGEELVSDDGTWVGDETISFAYRWLRATSGAGAGAAAIGGETTDTYTIDDGTNEVQSITVNATGGTFTVTFAGQTTAAQNYNVSAANLKTALEGLSTIGAGNVDVSGGPGDDGGTTPYVVTFQGDLAATNVAAMTTNDGSLTGGAGTAAVATTTPGVASVDADKYLACEVTATNAAGDTVAVSEYVGPVTIS